jgi:transposase-like protein
MTGNRKRYSAEFKAKVAVEAIRKELTVSQLVAKHGVHQTLINAWKKQAIEGMAGVFSGKHDTDLNQAYPSRKTVRGMGTSSEHASETRSGVKNLKLPDVNSRRDTAWFLSPSVLLGTTGFLSSFPALRGVDLETSAVIAGLVGLAGVSLGLVMSDATFPDGRKGFGRAGALFLGLACMMPSIMLGGALRDNTAYLFMGAAIWVMTSGLLFAQLFRLSAEQSLRFAAIFYGGSSVLLAISVVSPVAWPYIGTVAWLFGGWPAAWINTYVRVKYPVPPESPPIDGDDEPEETSPPPSCATALPREEDEDGDEVSALPVVPPQTLPGSQLALRWGLAVLFDYAVLVGLFIVGISVAKDAGVGMDGALSALSWYFAIVVLYQPIGERFGGTLGQRINKIQIIEPGRPEHSPDTSVVAWRAMLRIGFFWGFLSSLFYWLDAVFIDPKDRERMAQGFPSSYPRREWMFIER